MKTQANKTPLSKTGQKVKEKVSQISSKPIAPKFLLTNEMKSLSAVLEEKLKKPSKYRNLRLHTTYVGSKVVLKK